MQGTVIDKNARLVKTDIDYRYDVIGTWEGQTSSGLNVRWEIKPDGTYVYSRQEGDGDWETMVDYFNEYFADGYLFCARWKNIASGLPEQRQWWEIESIRDGVMKSLEEARAAGMIGKSLEAKVILTVKDEETIELLAKAGFETVFPACGSDNSAIELTPP